MKLTSTQPQPGAINVAIFQRMSNGEMATAIEQEYKLCIEDFAHADKSEIDSYTSGLRSNPEELFIDPCYDVCEDAFVCAFEFEN